MDGYKSPLHIISARLAEQWITLARQTVDGKSNEIPAMRELLELLDIEGRIITADAPRCRKGTAKAVIKDKGDYVLNVKDKQPMLKEEIAGYVQDTQLRGAMDSHTMCEKTSGRVELRTAYTTQDIGWLYGREDWEKLSCIGAVNTRCTSKKGTSGERRYYISSRGLTTEELPRYTRFGEDFRRIEDRNARQNLNIVRKIALNTIKVYKTKTASKRPISKIMLDCLLEPENILSVLNINEN
jgi:predicted transposase YbfD/YdcC